MEYKYKKCSVCSAEELFSESDQKLVCHQCKSKKLMEERGMLVHLYENRHRGSWEEFAGKDKSYSEVPCNCRLPGGRYCDMVTGHAKAISVIICKKCKDRITENTLAECVAEDDDAIQ